MDNRRKSLRAYSHPFDLRRYRPERWVTASEELHWLVEDLDASRHSPAVPGKMLRLLRKASPVEIRAVNIVEWKSPKRKR
jgi:hypothetical protein